MDWKYEPNKRALAILRVSSHRQTDNFSHELQESEIQEYCKRHHLTLVEVRKITESAKNSEKRHQYNAALDWALENGCLHVLFFVADRESRNLQDVEQNEKSVREGKICIHYVRDNRVLHKTSPDGDFFLRDILAASNKQFVRTLSGKVSDAMRKKAQEGWLPSNHVPLGYIHQRNRDENGREKKRGTTIVPDSNPQTIRLVLREFELRAQGYSYDAIHETTISEGLVQNRKTYSRSGIEKRLKNPFYSGEFDWDGVRYKGKHQLIISKDLLQQVQQSFRSKGYNPRLGQSPFPSGWLKCSDPECGCYITFDPKTKTLKGSKEKLRFEYFRCSNGKKIHKSMRGLHFKEVEIWKMLEEPVKEVSLTPSFADDVWAEFKKVHADFKIQKKLEMDGFREGLKKLEGAEDRLYDDLRSGLLDDMAYKRQLHRIREERSHFVNVLEKADVDIFDAVLDVAQAAITLCKDAESQYNSHSPSEKLSMLKKLLSHPQLQGGVERKLKYSLKYEVAGLAEARRAEAVSKDWRTQCESLRTAVESYTYDLSA